MGEPHHEQFDDRQKLEILRSTLSLYRRYLVPSRIVPNLGQLLGGVEGLARREILAKENAGDRVGAVDMLMKIVLDKGAEGCNLFIHALHGDDDEPCWARLLEPLEGTDNRDDNKHANEYFAFILGLLEGAIIAQIAPGELMEIMFLLYANSVIDEVGVDTILRTHGQRGHYAAALETFTQMSMHTEDWPRQFFIALTEVKPVLVHKIDPCNENPMTKQNLALAAGETVNMTQTKRADSSECGEQTLRKEPVIPKGAEGGLHSAFDKQARIFGDGDTASTVRAAAAAASSRGGDDDDDTSDGGFSDEEKYTYEASEKQVQKPEKALEYRDKGARPKHEHHKPRDLALRKYQEELAAPALAGRNTIICAPTGSGKTRVALHIVLQHLKSGSQGKRKVVFLARTGPLVAQQFKNFNKFLSEYPAVKVTGESEHSQNLHGLMDSYDILVLTPKILENHLTPDKIPSLSVFSLIIFDECHHTRKGEPYNSVMKSYLKSKMGKTGLPQIVGLTASIGVEKATTVDQAKESILGVMGNLDVSCLSVVKEHFEELIDTVPRPQEVLVQLLPRDNDEISEEIYNIMMHLEKLLRESASKTMADPEIKGVLGVLDKIPNERRTQKYNQWAVMLREQVLLLKKPERARNVEEAELIERRITFSHEVQILANALMAYNEALDVHDLTRPCDVLEYLRDKFKLRVLDIRAINTTELEAEVLGYFRQLERNIQTLSTPNPNLDTLAQTLIQHLGDQGVESHIIIFVRTRATCSALCKWLNSKEVDSLLRQLNAMPFTGSGAHQDQGGITQSQQENVVEKFRNGDIKLIVSTSVGEEGIDIPECNLTIKYNHVGNEVTTVQTRGRSRKVGGLSILLGMPRIIMQEQLNRQREKYMHQAIQDISHMQEREIARKVQEVQDKVMEEEEIKEVAKQKRKQPKKHGQFFLACRECHKVKVDGSQIRKIDAHRVIIGSDIDNQVTTRKDFDMRTFPEYDLGGCVICKCKNRLGQMLLYKGIDFMTVGIKHWVLLNERGDPKICKQWKDLPYDIKDLTAKDMRSHMAAKASADSETSDEE